MKTNEMEIKEVTRFDRFKGFVKAHKVGIATTAIGSAVVIGLGIVLGKDSTPEITGIEESVSPEDLLTNEVHEGVFLDIAPRIADAVLDSDKPIESFDEAFDLGDNVSKLVEVKVTEVVGD